MTKNTVSGIYFHPKLKTIKIVIMLVYFTFSSESVTTLNVTKVTSKPRTKDIPVTHSPDNNHPRVHPKHGMHNATKKIFLF